MIPPSAQPFFRGRRWRREVWRWPTSPPPIVAPSEPPIFTDEDSGPVQFGPVEPATTDDDGGTGDRP